MAKQKKGDTIIEVMLAVSIFATLMVGGLFLMNNGLARAQGTLQITMARNAMDTQAELLRFINSAYIANYPDDTGRGAAALWTSITSRAKTSATDLSDCNTGRSDSNSFVIAPNNLTVQRGIVAANTFPQIGYSRTANQERTEVNNLIDLRSASYSNSQGLWVEPVRGSGYYDFHIRACWNAPGSPTDTTLGTIVRLYAPTV